LTLSLRRRQLTITLPVKDWSGSQRLVVGSTAVKVYGEDEWKARQHGVGKRRTWRKLHFCADESALEIISGMANANDLTDAEALADLLADTLGEIEQISADGAYDQRKFYDALNPRDAKAARLQTWEVDSQFKSIDVDCQSYLNIR